MRERETIGGKGGGVTYQRAYFVPEAINHRLHRRRCHLEMCTFCFRGGNGTWTGTKGFNRGLSRGLNAMRRGAEAYSMHDFVVLVGERVNGHL